MNILEKIKGLEASLNMSEPKFTREEAEKVSEEFLSEMVPTIVKGLEMSKVVVPSLVKGMISGALAEVYREDELYRDLTPKNIDIALETVRSFLEKHMQKMVTKRMNTALNGLASELSSICDCDECKSGRTKH